MEKLKMQTVNKADENFKKLSELFPNAVTETINEEGEIIRAIDKDVLMQEINTKVIEGHEERYQFTWPDKKKAILLANAPISKTLRPCREESMNFDTTENLYIEGDNLEVLKLLQETYLGKVKMIYIDPPYNTGNDSFLYNDNYTETMSDFSIRNKNKDEFGNIIYDIRVNNNTNGRFHTDWLNMMYSRLKLTRNLLCEDGVLFISIDNNEVSNLKKICDEIFGENSFITIIHVQMSTVQGQKVKAAKAGNIVKNGEYILVYSKNGKKDIGKKPLFDPVKYDNHYNKFLLENEDGSFSEKSLVEIIGNEKEILDELVVLGLISSNKKVISSKKLQ